MGGSLGGVPRGAPARKTAISKTNDVAIAHARRRLFTELAGQEGEGPRQGDGYLWGSYSEIW